jgi:hypothetical protein
MSLIDEALKRARQEAARQDEAARELRYRQVPVIPGLRQPARRRWLLPVVIAACLLAGIGIGLGLALSRGGGGEDQRAAVPPPPSAPLQAEAVPAPSVPEAPPPAPVPVVEEEPAPPVVEEKPPVPEAAAPPAQPVQEEPAVADMRQREIVLNPTAPSPSAEPEPAPSAPEPAPVPVITEDGQTRTYQQELPLAGGGTLRLNGIAFSDRPVALFGDKVVAPGESVAGYKVLAIELRKVRLEGQGGVVVVELP